MGDRSAVIWAKLGHAEPQGGWDWGSKGLPSASPRPPPRAGPSRDSNQAHNAVSFLGST